MGEQRKMEKKASLQSERAWWELRGLRCVQELFILRVATDYNSTSRKVAGSVPDDVIGIFH